MDAGLKHFDTGLAEEILPTLFGVPQLTTYSTDIIPMLINYTVPPPPKRQLEYISVPAMV